VELEEGGIDTIGGLIFNRLGSLPKPGAQLRVAGLVCTVRRSSRKRIEEVLIERPLEEVDDGAAREDEDEEGDRK
jgi:CBS domain containing-hemolysin-like protein